MKYDSMHRKLILTVLTFIFGLTICGRVSSADFEQNYTLDSYITPSNPKLLIINGPGTYDTLSGIWNVGTLPVGGTAALELVLRAVNWGSSSNVAVVSSNLQDLNPIDNVVQIDFSVTQKVVDGPLNILTVDPPFNPESPEVSGDESSGETGGGSSGGSNGALNPPILGDSQLARDIQGVRESVGTGKPVIPEWNPDKNKSKETLEEKDYTVIFTLAVIIATVAVAYMKTKSQKFAKILKKLGIKYKNPPKSMKELVFWISDEFSIADFMDDPNDPLAYLFFVLSVFDLFDYISNEQIGMMITATGFALTTTSWIQDYFGVDVEELIKTQNN